MGFGKALRPTNRQVRILVGLVLAALFAVQCTSNAPAIKSSSDSVIVLDGKNIDNGNSEAANQMLQLAKSDQIAFLEKCLANYRQQYKDYTCTLTKQEMINGKVGDVQVTEVKFLGNPYSVAMTWTKNNPGGSIGADKLIYVEGKYNNQMVARPASAFARKLAGDSVLRQPDGEDAMKNTLRPVNRFGFERSLKALLEIYNLAKKQGDLKVEFGGLVQVKSSGRQAYRLVRYLPNKPEYHTAAQKTVTLIDTEYLVPVNVEGTDWNGDISSRYDFTDIVFNKGLSSKDFTPEANGMKEPPKQ